ncbi:MAG TPA: phosphotriesterase [Pseudonocardia sp.]|nr:phosphotriesterase [Pseudonocardia sp.]
MNPTVRTVLGDIPADQLGVCDAHDHLFFSSPLLPGQELDDPAAASAELALFGKLGGQAVAQWTPFGMGRDVAGLRAAARATGVNVLAATGMHQAPHYGPGVVDGAKPRLAELFVEELTAGIRERPGADPGESRAGMIKVAGEFHALSEHTRTVMTAAAEAHHATGAPIGVHLEHGTAGLDVIDLLCGELAVPPAAVLLGHLNREPDSYMHRAAADAGVYLAFDGPSRANHATDWRLFESLAALVAAGHADQLLVGGDTTTAAARAATGGGPGLPGLLRRLRPRLVYELGDEVTEQLFVANPARAFAVTWR